MREFSANLATVPLTVSEWRIRAEIMWRAALPDKYFSDNCDASSNLSLNINTYH